MGLTMQEAAIRPLVAGGYNKEVVRHRGISLGTVKNHIWDILRKRDARDRTHAVLGRSQGCRHRFPREARSRVELPIWKQTLEAGKH